MLSEADRQRAADLVVGAFLDAVNKSSLFASIDATPVADPTAYLEVTGYFDMGPTQAGSLLEALGVPAGTEAFPTKSGGYWLMIDGLAPGQHELHFGGSAEDWSVDTGTPIGTESGAAFSTETTDLINVVVPEPSSAALYLPRIGVSDRPTPRPPLPPSPRGCDRRPQASVGNPRAG